MRYNFVVHILENNGSLPRRACTLGDNGITLGDIVPFGHNMENREMLHEVPALIGKWNNLVVGFKLL